MKERGTGRSVKAMLVAVCLASCGGTPPSSPEPGLPSQAAVTAGTRYRIDPAHSHLRVRVVRSGMLSVHDHLFVPQRWGGVVRFDARRLDEVGIDLHVETASLHDEQEELSESARKEVDDDMRGPDGLDVARYSTVRLVGGRLEHVVHPADAADQRTLQGELVATLSLHGHTGVVRAPLSVRWGDGWLRAQGATSFLQSAFGVAPVSKFFGALAVKDRVLVEFDVVAVRDDGAGR